MSCYVKMVMRGDLGGGYWFRSIDYIKFFDDSNNQIACDSTHLVSQTYVGGRNNETGFNNFFGNTNDNSTPFQASQADPDPVVIANLSAIPHHAEVKSYQNTGGAKYVDIYLSSDNVTYGEATTVTFSTTNQIITTGELNGAPAVISAPTNLTATAGDAKVTLSWTAVSGATGYNVKRATTAGGPYTIASNVSGTSYVDTTVTNGTTYFYVVTAITPDGESANSNEALATPTAGTIPPVTGSVLRVTMNDSSEREYPLSNADIDSFVSWINSTAAIKSPSYLFNKQVGSQSSKEFLMLEKIISFEIF